MAEERRERRRRKMKLGEFKCNGFLTTGCVCIDVMLVIFVTLQRG